MSTPLQGNRQEKRAFSFRSAKVMIKEVSLCFFSAELGYLDILRCYSLKDILISHSVEITYFLCKF